MPEKFDFLSDLFAIDWSQFRWRGSLRRLPALVFCLSVAMWAGSPTPGVLITAAALSVGFSGFRRICGSRLLAMVFTTALMSLSALAGTLAGNSIYLTLLATGVWGFACGFVTVLGEDAGWVVMQGVIALLVATGFASVGVHALERALAILLGGLIQIAVLLALWRLQGLSRFGDEDGVPGTRHLFRKSVADFFNGFRDAFHLNSHPFHYALRVAVTLIFAVELDHILRLQNGYWLPMTTIIVLKPDFHRTYSGGMQRTLGTLSGVLASSLIALTFHPHGWSLPALIGIFGFFSYAFLKSNSVIFSAALTSFVIFLIAATGLPPTTVTWHRFINTCLGCALAMFSRFIGFHFVLPHFQKLDAAKRNSASGSPVGLP